MKRHLETAFLPAALEVRETPPVPAARLIVVLISLFFVAGLSWAAIGEVDIVSVAPGHIISGGHNKIVQPLDKGTVKVILVTEGQSVQSGEVLIELDSSDALADRTRLQDEWATADREVRRYRRLQALLSDEQNVLPGDPSESPDTLLAGLWQEFLDRRQVLEREQQRQRAERESAQQQVEKISAVLPIVTRRATDRKRLAAQKLLSREQYLETEQQRLELVHELRSRRAAVDELDGGIHELDARLAFARSEFLRQLMERHERAAQRRLVAEQELIKAEARLRAQTIRAPVDGVVQQLAIHNEGAIVVPAQELMVIVPRDGVLEVEAILENKDIGFVEAGQAVEVKIDTFPFTKYGTITGRVIDLSDDAVADENRGLVYKMRVAMDQSDISVNGRRVRLSPGMTVTVESKTGKRRLIEFFLSPLLRYTNESVRER